MSNKCNNPTIATPEYLSGPKGHPTNLTAVEDLMVTKGCCRASEDPISGANTEWTYIQKQKSVQYTIKNDSGFLPLLMDAQNLTQQSNLQLHEKENL